MSPKAIVAPAVPGTVFPEYLSSAYIEESITMPIVAGSAPSPKLIVPVSVPPAVVKIFTPSIETTPAETLAKVVSVACPNSSVATCRDVLITKAPAPKLPAKTEAAGSPVQFVRVPDVGVPNKGVTKVGEVEKTRLVDVVPVAPAAVYPVMLLKRVMLATPPPVPPSATAISVPFHTPTVIVPIVAKAA